MRRSLARPTAALMLAALALAGCGVKQEAGAGKAETASAMGTAPAAAPALGAGEAMLAVPGGRIWYKVSGEGSGLPLILLHGGPGFSSVYLKPLEALGSDRTVVRYDQSGGGRSDGLTDTTMFTIEHFVRELDSLRERVGAERVHLLGHSWGTILAVEYYRAHPEHVASLTLGSAALDIPGWEKHARQLVATLPDSLQRIIKTREAEKNFEAPDYQKAMEEFYGRYVWRTPDPAGLDTLFKTANMAIYNYMQGPSEFTITGTLKQYDASQVLKTVKVPTLYLVGELDEADPASIRRFSSLTPGSRMVTIPGAAHLMTWDNPTAVLAAVRPFLAAADSSSVKR